MKQLKTRFIRHYHRAKVASGVMSWHGGMPGLACRFVGINFLDEFVESTKEYQDATDSKEEQRLKGEAFEKWMVVLYIRNSDQRKYGMLLSIQCTLF